MEDHASLHEKEVVKPSTPKPKLSWNEVDSFVSKSRILQFRDIHSLPSQFTFYRNHVFFVGASKSDVEIPFGNTLLYVDLQSVDVQSVEPAESSMYSIYDGESPMKTDEGDNPNLNFPGNDHKKESPGNEHEKELQGNEHKKESPGNDQDSLSWLQSGYKCETLLSFDPSYSMDQIGNPNYSKEQELLRERKRLSAHGITSYEFHQPSGRIVFAALNSLYWLDVNDVVERKCKHLVANEIQTSLPGSRMDAKICHRNPDLISFIYSGDIWVANIATSQELRLTFVRGPGRDEFVSAGVPSYVTQEEFDRFTGYWWQPHQEMSPESDEVEVHKILYEMVDESMVAKHHIVSTSEDGNTQLDTYRYPKAGSKNAESTLRLVQFSVFKKSKEILDGSIFEHELRYELSSLIPWVEYIVRCEWMADGKSVWAQLLNRRQNRLALVRIPLDVFRIKSSSRSEEVHESNSNIEILLEEMSDYWINLSDIIHFLPTVSTASTTKLVWSSEGLGHRHLFLYTIEDDPCRHSKSQTSSQKTQKNRNNLHICDVLSCAQLTEGDWEVSPNKIWVDEKNQLIYFNGRKEIPTEDQLYVTSFQFVSDVKRLTQGGLSHITQLDENFNWLVTVSSSLTNPGQVHLSRVNYKDKMAIEDLSLQPQGWIERPRAMKSNIDSEFFSYKNKRGFEVHGLLLKRKDLEVNKKHPTVVFVYGGPGVQLVTNSQKALRRAGLHSIVSFGYIVVVMDTMGSYHRGIQFEAILKDSMGTVEIEEQVEGLKFIASTCQCIDMDRVAIHGWSYGGYLSLMGLAQRPDIFKAPYPITQVNGFNRLAIAGAPVISWELYDTGYTERYMNLPESNPDGYKKGSVLEYVEMFPNE
eukprot:gene19404-21327_t